MARPHPQVRQRPRAGMGWPRPGLRRGRRGPEVGCKQGAARMVRRLPARRADCPAWAIALPATRRRPLHHAQIRLVTITSQFRLLHPRDALRAAACRPVPSGAQTGICVGEAGCCAVLPPAHRRSTPPRAGRAPYPGGRPGAPRRAGGRSGARRHSVRWPPAIAIGRTTVQRLALQCVGWSSRLPSPRRCPLSAGAIRCPARRSNHPGDAASLQREWHCGYHPSG
jgi:hypothetical protein